MISEQELNHLQGLLYGLGVRNRNDSTRLDAGETAFIAKQLEYVKATTYDVLYAPARARTFVPLDNSVPAGAESYGYDKWDVIGMAQIISNYADDLPNVDTFVTRVLAKCESLGDSYQYSIQDLRASQMAGARLDQRRAAVARDMVERKIDDLIAFGSTVNGLEGFTNHSAVGLVAPITGNWTSSTTGAQMIADLNKLVNSIFLATAGVHTADTLLVDPQSWTYLTTPIGADFNTTVLEVFTRTNPFIKNVDQWYKLATADAAGTGPRFIAYQRSPLVLDYVISAEFTQEAPQAHNLVFKVPCHARVGEVNIHYPLALAYMDRQH